MLLDWITARISYESLPAEIVSAISASGDRIMRYCPVSGEVRWESSAWESVRSDSHQITCRAGGDAFWIQGSPARVTGTGCSVFGSGPSSSLDLVGCVRSMAEFIFKQFSVIVPFVPAHWTVSRIDVTQNLLFKDLPTVRVALRYLRDCEGGRYRVSQQAGDTVYWSHKSRLRSGKAYAKGPHLEYAIKRPQYTGCSYSPDQIAFANRLLRLELTLGAQFLRERSSQWFLITPDELKQHWNSYFLKMIGDASMTPDSDIKPNIYTAASAIAKSRNPSSSGDGLAKSAYSMWLLIQAEGWERTKDCTPSSSWYRNLQVLRACGLGDMDISAGKVIPFRQKIIDSEHVNSWPVFSSVA